MASTVRVDDTVHAALLEIATVEGRAIGRVIEDAVIQYRKEKFWQGVREDYERLQADPVAWNSYLEEIRFFEGGSLDGLLNEEPYYTREEEDDIRAGGSRTPGR